MADLRTEEIEAMDADIFLSRSSAWMSSTLRWPLEMNITSAILRLCRVTR